MLVYIHVYVFKVNTIEPSGPFSVKGTFLLNYACWRCFGYTYRCLSLCSDLTSRAGVWAGPAQHFLFMKAHDVTDCITGYKLSFLSCTASSVLLLKPFESKWVCKIDEVFCFLANLFVNERLMRFRCVQICMKPVRFGQPGFFKMTENKIHQEETWAVCWCCRLIAISH